MAEPSPPSEPLLASSQRAKIRRLSRPKEVSPDQGGELNVVPFLDILVNVLIFVLASVAVVFVTSIAMRPPVHPTGSKVRPDTPPLGLSLLVVADGFSLKAAGGNVGPGCDDLGSGVAVQKRSGRYDFSGLTKCVDKLKRSSDEFRNERQIVVAANPGVSYQTIISTMDAVRRTRDGRLLFDQVTFGVPR